MEYRFPITLASFRNSLVSHLIRKRDRTLQILPDEFKKRSLTIKVSVRAERVTWTGVETLGIQTESVLSKRR